MVLKNVTVFSILEHLVAYPLGILRDDVNIFQTFGLTRAEECNSLFCCFFTNVRMFNYIIFELVIIIKTIYLFN